MTFLAFNLGVFSLWRNPKARVVQLWFLTSMAVTVWGIGYLLAINAQSDAESFFYLRRLVYVGASLIPIFSFHFIAAFLFKHIKYKSLIFFGYILGLIFLILINFTNFIIKGVQYLENFGRYEEVANFGFKLFLIYFLFFAFFGFYLLLIGYKENDGIRKRQIFYFILAHTFGFLGGISNFITDLNGIYPYGQMIVWLYPIFVTYGIFINEIKIKIKF